MCDPVSITLIAAAALTAGGQVYSGMAQNAQGKYAAAINNRNAQMSEANAQDARKRGEQEQLAVWRRASQRMGTQRADQAALGLDVNFGTPADVVDDTLKLGYEDAFTTAENTKREVKGFDIEAANYKAQATADKMKGHAALIGGLIGGAGTILGGASQVAKQRAPA